MGVALGVKIALIVTPIDGSIDHVYVGLVFALGLIITGFRILLALGLLDVILRRRTHEGDLLAVGRPDRVRGSFGEIGNRRSFPSSERQHCELTRLRFAAFVFVTAANE